MEVNKVICGDCLEEMKKMENNSVDLILIDPPYFETRGEFDFIWKNYKEYKTFMFDVLIELNRVLKNTGSIYIYGLYEVLVDMYLFLKKNKLNFRQFITWNFKNGNRTNNNFSMVCEYILYFTKSDNFTFNMDDIRTKDWVHGKWEKGCNINGMCATNYFEDNKIVHNNKYERTSHPTQKPLSQIKKLILASSNKNNIVLDCFAGSGTTGVACKQLGRNYILIEKEQKYIDIINKRLQQGVL